MLKQTYFFHTIRIYKYLMSENNSQFVLGIIIHSF